MSIFGNRSRSYEPEVVYEGIQPTAESMDQIITESAQDSYKIRAGMYISDVMMEEAIFEGAATPEVLLEAFGKGLFDKIKAMFKKLWDKIISWFAQVKRALALLFSTGKEFVDKFEKELRDKNDKGYIYTSYKYTYNAGLSKVEDLTKKLKAATDKYMGSFAEIDDAKVASNQAERLGNGKYEKEYNSQEEKEKILKSLGGDNLEEVVTEVEKAFRDNAEQPEEFEDFRNNTKEEMIKFIKDKDKAIREVETEERKMNAQYSRIIKAIEAGANKHKGDDYSKISPYVTHATEMLRFASTTMAKLSQVEVMIIKEMAREFETTLKGYLRFKPVKDSYESYDGDGDSILESAMRFV